MKIAVQEYLNLNRVLFSSAPSKETDIDELIKVSKEDGKVDDV